MSLERQLADITNELAHIIATIGVVPGPTGRFGKGDGTGTLLVPDSPVPGTVFLHDPLTNQQDQAYLPQEVPLILMQDGNAKVEDMEVTTGYKYGSEVLSVIGVNTQAGRSGVGTMSPFWEYLNKAYWASADQITILRPHPYAPTPINDLWVDGPFPYVVPSTGVPRIFLGGGSNGDLPAAIAALTGTGKQQLAMLYFDKELKQLHARTLTAVTPANTPGTQAARAEFTSVDIEAFTVNAALEIPIYAVYLYDGQTTLGANDMLFDMRPFLSGASTGGQQFLQDYIDISIIIPTKCQATYTDSIHMLDGGSLHVYGRMFVKAG